MSLFAALIGGFIQAGQSERPTRSHFDYFRRKTNSYYGYWNKHCFNTYKIFSTILFIKLVNWSYDVVFLSTIDI